MPTYGSILTHIGKAKIAQALLTQVPVRLTAMSVGDGAGNATTPQEAQTALVREVYRRSINSQVASGPASLTLEMIIPNEVGPFVVRELGVWDADGELFAVANLPPSTKTVVTDGATRDMAIEVTLAVDNPDALNVVINPNIIIATRQWVHAGYVHMPGDGTTGQLLRKSSNNPNEWEYYSPEFDASNFVFDAIEEPQTLADGQDLVDWAQIGTAGIAVYVRKQDGGRLERLIRGQDFTVLSPTRIQLADTYPAGTPILGVQNAPNGNIQPHGINALDRRENLADIPNKEAARLALDVFSRAQIRNMVPAGMISAFAGAAVPDDWVVCDGRALSVVNDARLFAVIGRTYSTVQADQFFNVPDLRDMFIRGKSDSRALGSVQPSENKSHAHTGTANTGGRHGHGTVVQEAGEHAHTGNTGNTGDHTHAEKVAQRNSSSSGGSVNAPQQVGNGDTLGINDGSVIQTAGAHNHPLTTNTTGRHGHPVTVLEGGEHGHTLTIDAAGGSESRPINMALVYAIKR